MHSQNKNIIKQPCLSYWGIYKSARVLNLFIFWYLPLYDLSPQNFYIYYPVLVFVEALIYEADEDVEADYTGKQEFFGMNPWNYRKNLIIKLLQKLNLEHPLIVERLDDLGRLWDLEKQMILQKNIFHADIIKVPEIRAADLRALHFSQDARSTL